MKKNIKKHIALYTTFIFAGLASTVVAANTINTAPTQKISTRKTRQKRKKSAPFNAATTALSKSEKSILNSTTGLKPKVLKLGLNAYQWVSHHTGTVKNPYLTIVDFSIPSKDKRMWIINMQTHKVVMKTLVANGKNSGLYEGTQFSNKDGSLQSSLGVYVTGSQYYGNDGLSMHVRGLQAGVNSNAYQRCIEFHGAWYVTPAFARQYGRVGGSWGCFALDKSVLPKVVKTIENGSVVFAYASNHSADYRPYA